jgi:predicted metal-dependent hydrolase
MSSTKSFPVEYHSINLPWGVCNYLLKRSHRKSVGFLIGKQGLQISIPLRLSMTALHPIIQTKSKWILCKLDQQKKRIQKTISLKELLDGDKPIPVRGELYQIDTLSTHNKALLNPWAQCITLPCQMTKEQRIKVIEKILKAHAKEVFIHMANQVAKRQFDLPVCLPKFSIHLSSPISRWGSCNSKHEVRLNWRLVHYPAQFIEYVIAHELAHLIEMNHSPRFWSLLETLMPDYQIPHQILSEMNPAEVPLL